eukprot:2932898-Prorocentrum_lima.AAC.1
MTTGKAPIGTRTNVNKGSWPGNWDVNGLTAEEPSLVVQETNWSPPQQQTISPPFVAMPPPE